MHRKAVMVMLHDMMVLGPRCRHGIDVNGCIRKIPEMMKKFMPVFFCNRVTFFNGQ